MDYLHRHAAPFADDIWRRIDEAAVAAAREVLTCRRFLEVNGPYGVGLTAIEIGHDDYCRQTKSEEAGAVMGRAISLPMLRKPFRARPSRISNPPRLASLLVRRTERSSPAGRCAASCRSGGPARA